MKRGANRYSSKLRFLAATMTAMCLVSSRFAFSSAGGVASRGISAFLALASGTMLVVFVHLSTLPVSRLHTLTTAIIHYLMNVVVYLLGYSLWLKSEKQLKNVKTTQLELLRQVVSQNATTDYGKRFHFEDITDYDSYKAAVPLSNYEDYRQYVDRIERGEQNVLCRDKVIRLNVSSGTTGKCKLLPSTRQMVTKIVSGFVIPLIYRQRVKYQRLASPFAPVKTVDMLFAPKWRYASCGLPIGPLSGNPGKEGFITTIQRTTPPGCQEFMLEPAQLYIHWLFALYDDEVAGFNGSFAGSAIVSFEFIAENWRQVVEDIRRGTLNNTFEIPDEVASLVNLEPNPQRADFLEIEFSKGLGGIVKRVWPSINLSWCISTGAHAVYVDRLRWFLGKDVAILSPLLASSEAGVFGIPMNATQDETMTYGLLAGLTFMEFIPEEEVDRESPTMLLMHQLQVGKRYEIVPSSSIGFYRYRIGDIVRVVDFYHETPVVEFCTRVGGMLDLHGEKTTEDMIFKALQQTITLWQSSNCSTARSVKFRLQDFTSSEGESLAKALPQLRQSYLHYVLFVEIEGFTRSPSFEEIATFDDVLSNLSYPYKSFRTKGGIGFPKMVAVKPGTFEALKRFILERNSAVSNQYKTPRYQTNPDYLRFLMDFAYIQE